MVKITFSPIKELIVHEVVSIDHDDLLRSRVTPSGNMPLYWCDGILFSFNSMPMTKDLVKEYLNGTIHWMEVHYTHMKNYEPVVVLNDEQYKGSMYIRVFDTTKSALHVEFMKWLKTSRK